jgi:hypothetical protein
MKPYHLNYTCTILNEFKICLVMEIKTNNLVLCKFKWKEQNPCVCGSLKLRRKEKPFNFLRQKIGLKSY